MAHRLRDCVQLPNERQAPVPPEIIAGSLAYMAPEQTAA